MESAATAGHRGKGRSSRAVLRQFHEEVTVWPTPSVAGDAADKLLAAVVDPNQRSLTPVARPEGIIHFE